MQFQKCPDSCGWGLVLDWMQLFGMMPAVPSFGEHVRDALLRFYPKPNVTRLTSQNQLNLRVHTYLYTYPLDPTELLACSLTLSVTFIYEQKLVYMKLRSSSKTPFINVYVVVKSSFFFLLVDINFVACFPSNCQFFRPN